MMQEHALRINAVDGESRGVYLTRVLHQNERLDTPVFGGNILWLCGGGPSKLVQSRRVLGLHQWTYGNWPAERGVVYEHVCLVAEWPSVQDRAAVVQRLGWLVLEALDDTLGDVAGLDVSGLVGEFYFGEIYPAVRRMHLEQTADGNNPRLPTLCPQFPQGVPPRHSSHSSPWYDWFPSRNSKWMQHVALTEYEREAVQGKCDSVHPLAQLHESLLRWDGVTINDTPLALW
ncbi:MAG: hypothetical protein MHM6MM_000538 [Cercozoa sp. M6MM]